MPRFNRLPVPAARASSWASCARHLQWTASSGSSHSGQDFCWSPGNRLTNEGIDDAKTVKTTEILVCRVKRGAMFNGQCGEMCVTHHRAADLCVHQHVPQNLPMAASRLQHVNIVQVEPSVHDLARFGHRIWVSHHRTLCCQPQKGENGKQRKPYGVIARKNIFEPLLRLIVLFGPVVVCVDEDIRVNKDHFQPGPSISSSSREMQSKFRSGRAPRFRERTLNRFFCPTVFGCRPRLTASLRTCRNGAPVRRDSESSLAATSSSRVTVVRLAIHHDANLFTS